MSYAMSIPGIGPPGGGGLIGDTTRSLLHEPNAVKRRRRRSRLCKEAQIPFRVKSMKYNSESPRRVDLTERACSKASLQALRSFNHTVIFATSLRLVFLSVHFG